MEAEVRLEYDDLRTAESVAKAVSPDNFKTPTGLFIRTNLSGRRVITSLTHNGKFSTFIATIDDLLFCASTAEKTLKTARSIEKSRRRK